MATVTKPFTTRLRRLRPGDTVSPGDDLSPYSFGALRAGGYLAPLPARRAASRPKTRRKPS